MAAILFFARRHNAGSQPIKKDSSKQQKKYQTDYLELHTMRNDALPLNTHVHRKGCL